MEEFIDCIDHILSCLQYFCLGGMLFSDRKKVIYWIMAILSLIFGVANIML
jgi:hypothetical protein